MPVEEPSRNLSFLSYFAASDSNFSNCSSHPPNIDKEILLSKYVFLINKQDTGLRDRCLKYASETSFLQSRKNGIVFTPSGNVSSSKEIEIHEYNRLQCYDKDEYYDRWPDMIDGRIIRLGDREPPIAVEKCVNFSDNQHLKAIHNHVNTLTKDILPHSLGAAAFHKQTDRNSKSITQYPPHFDKISIGYVVFCPVHGNSFHFLAFPSTHHQIIDDETSTCHQDKYESWKISLNNSMKASIQTFENNFRRKAKTSRVLVFNIKPGQIICFHATTILHATIIPISDNHSSRQILIFHQMDK